MFSPLHTKSKAFPQQSLRHLVEEEDDDGLQPLPFDERSRRLSQFTTHVLPAEPEAKARGASHKFVGELPHLWSIRLQVRAFSESPFGWCSSSQLSDSSSKGGTMQQRCAYHQHPAHTVACVSGAQAAEYYPARGKEWLAAFVSLYDLLCTGRCPYFYFLREGSFTALFFAGQSRHNSVQQPFAHRTAVLANVSEVTEQALRSAGLNPEPALGTIFSDESDIMCKPARETSDSNLRHELLVFSGKAQVHALFDYLLQTPDFPPYNFRETPTLQSDATKRTVTTASLPQSLRRFAADGGGFAPPPLPLLISPVAFTHAVMRHPRVTNLGAVAQYHGGKQSSQFELEITGILLPGAHNALCGLLGTTQPKGFSLRYPAVPQVAILAATQQYAVLTSGEWDPSSCPLLLADEEDAAKPGAVSLVQRGLPPPILPRHVLRLDFYCGSIVAHYANED